MVKDVVDIAGNAMLQIVSNKASISYTSCFMKHLGSGSQSTNTHCLCREKERGNQ